MITKEQIIAEIKQFHAEHGRVPKCNELSMSDETMRRRFNSWQNAVEAAGYLPQQRRSNLSIEEMKQWITKKIIIDSNGCWIALGNAKPTGYYTIRYNNKMWFSHRLTYTLWKGKISPNMQIMHLCDNPSCCNPEHLREGTRQENQLDCIVKNRRNNPPKCDAKIRPSGLFGKELLDWIRDIDTNRNENNCWIWKKTTHSGYGLIRIRQKTLRVHRLVYELVYGQIEDKQIIRHICNNKICCNPEHLTAGTQSENANDTKKYHSQIIITEELVHDILKDYILWLQDDCLYGDTIGNFTKFWTDIIGCSRQTIQDVLRLKTWVDVSYQYRDKILS